MSRMSVISFIVVAIVLTVPILFVGCASSNDKSTTGDTSLSVPTETTVMVDGYPLTCVTDVGYSNYGGGVSCDWDSWNALKGATG